MRIISWNIRAGGGRRVDEIARQLERWQPDVVALSEFRATPPSQQLARSMAIFGLTEQLQATAQENRASNGLLLASRYPLQRISLAMEPQEPLRWLLARIESDYPFCLGAMHVPNRVTGRKYPYHEAVLAVVRAWSGGAALVIGDTNTGKPGLDEEVATFNRQEKTWMESLENAGWRDLYRVLKGDQRTYTWYSPNGGNGFRLDQAFVNADLMPHVIEMRYEWGQPEPVSTRRDALSDHAAILLDLKEPG